MSCFWDALISKLNNKELNHIQINKRIRPKELCLKLKLLNKIISDNILWQGKPINELERKEHYLTIKNNVCFVNNGHLTSSCDSFLLLICDLCKVNISHKGMYGISSYINPLSDRTIILYSNRGHMW